MEREIEISKDHTFTWRYYSNGLQEIPTAVTVTIVDNSGTEISSGAGSISLTGDITYTLSASDIATITKNNKVTVSRTVSGVVYNVSYLFDVVHTPIMCEVTDEDLYIYLSDIKKVYSYRSDTTTADGTTSTLISTTLSLTGDNYTGGWVDIYLPALTHTAQVTAQSGATITFAPVAPAVVTAETNYRIRGAYTKQIQEAFNIALSDIRGRIGIAARAIDSTIIKRAIIYKALSIICFSAGDDERDRWYIKSEKFDMEYSNEIQKLAIPVDADDTGNISDYEAEHPDTGASVSIQL